MFVSRPLTHIYDYLIVYAQYLLKKFSTILIPLEIEKWWIQSVERLKKIERYSMKSKSKVFQCNLSENLKNN